MSETLAFIGLGNMGYPMAGHLQTAGYSVTVYNRTQKTADDWVAQYGGKSASSPKAAAEGASVVFVCVGNDDHLRSVVLGDDGALAGMGSGTYLVDHTTASADIAREIGAAASAKSIEFLDAPVSGGQEGAQKGALTVMVGGSNAGYAHVEPIIEIFAKSVVLMGPVGSGQLTKMCNQMCCASNLQGLAEGVNFAQSAGLDIPALIDVISKGAAQSWQMENRAVSMAEGRFDFGFACDWMRKDLRLCLDEARRVGAIVPLTALVETFYGQVQANGDGRADNSALITLLKNR